MLFLVDLGRSYTLWLPSPGLRVTDFFSAENFHRATSREIRRASCFFKISQSQKTQLRIWPNLSTLKAKKKAAVVPELNRESLFAAQSRSEKTAKKQTA